MALGSALGLVLLARNAGIAISHPAGFCMPSVGPYYIPSFCVAGVAQSHIHREFLWQPWYNFMQGVVQIAATKCEKGAVQSFMQGACKIVVAKSGKGAVQGVVQGTVQGGVEGAVQTAVAMSGKSAVCKV